MQVDDLKVVDVYTGGRRRVALIDTEERELSILLNVFQIEEGKTYRFTYMEWTGNILNIENWWQRGFKAITSKNPFYI